MLTEVAPPEATKPSLRKMLVVYSIGTVIVVSGLFLWIGNVSGIFTTFRGAGLFTVLAGGAFFYWGDKILMGID